MKTFVPRDDMGINNRKMSYISIDKYPSVHGLIAMIMGLAELVIFLILCIISYNQKGASGMWIGVLGLLLMVAAITGIGITIYGMQDPEAKRTRLWIGMLENIAMLVLLTILYIKGF